MKLNNKGFSLVEIIAVMVVLGILLALGVSEYSKYIVSSTEKAYDMFAKNIGSAAEEYAMDHPSATNVTIEKLYEENYLESLTDPGKNEQDCTGKVNITKIEDVDSSKIDYNYYSVNICCDKYNYTYKLPDGNKSEDEFCRAYPYDITQIEDIQVLNVYPNKTYAEYVKNWMNTYGKGIIHVKPVFIDDFNTTPQEYLGRSGNWKYDVVVFGFADCNSSKDLSVLSAELVDNFLNEGGSVIFGHDTITKGCGNHKNFISLQHHVNLEATSDLAFTSKNKIRIIKSGVFTEYPYKIGDVNTELTVPLTHVYGQVASGEQWLIFDGIGTPAKSIYLSTYGNNAFIQTGHSNGKATEDEQKIITNIIFYAKSKQYD